MFAMLGKAIHDALQSQEATQSIEVYYRIAPATAITPYIIIQHVGGGETNSSPVNSFDIDADVFAVSESMVQANTLSKAISAALKDVEIVYDGYYPLAPVRERQLVFDMTEVQGRQFFAIGAMYNFRGVKQ